MTRVRSALPAIIYICGLLFLLAGIYRYLCEVSDSVKSQKTTRGSAAACVREFANKIHDQLCFHLF